MFFFGAFSGNLLYLILAISYLAGCSALVFRSPEDQEKDLKTSDKTSSHVLCYNTLPKHSVLFHTVNTNLSDQVLSEVISAPSQIKHYSKILFIPPLLLRQSYFSGYALFSRPPPSSLV
jgi:hypothetical protein